MDTLELCKVLAAIEESIADVQSRLPLPRTSSLQHSLSNSRLKLASLVITLTPKSQAVSARATSRTAPSVPSHPVPAITTSSAKTSIPKTLNPAKTSETSETSTQGTSELESLGLTELFSREFANFQASAD